MKTKAGIVGVYTSNQDGEEYVTRNGNPYLKLLWKTDDEKTIYDSFFMTEKAHWKCEKLFEACGSKAPSATDIGTKDFENLIGKKCVVEIGKNKAGYDTVFKYELAVDEPKIEEPIEPIEVDEDDLDEIPF